MVQNVISASHEHMDMICTDFAVLRHQIRARNAGPCRDGGEGWTRISAPEFILGLCIASSIQHLKMRLRDPGPRTLLDRQSSIGRMGTSNDSSSAGKALKWCEMHS